MDTAAQSSGRSQQQTSTIAYAIPINKAMQVIRQIQSGQGTALVHIGNTRALLGVETVDGPGGASVHLTQPGSPAAAAGITANSTITALNGQSVGTSLALRNAIVAHNPGASASVTWTDPQGVSHTATVTLGSGPASLSRAARATPGRKAAERARGAPQGASSPPNQPGVAELAATLPAGLLQHLLVLVLAHLLAPLLDDRTHEAGTIPDPRRRTPQRVRQRSRRRGTCTAPLPCGNRPVSTATATLPT